MNNENKDIFLKPYDPVSQEGEIYKKWEKSGLFNPDECVRTGITEENAESYTVMMPPPNANGSLHAGHALFVTLEDIMIRFERMRGKRALWLPGADHAGFETQVVYEKKLEKEGRSRFEMSREDLYKEILDFTLKSKSLMEGQLRALGASCDWSREIFTLDERIIKIVYDTFKKLSDDKLLYRGSRIVNWCAKHQTSLSNLETESDTKTDNFYYLKYGPFVIGTARPETKFGDKFVVMHPDDARYKNYKHGDTFTTEWINGEIKATVIKDDSIDMTFGTGVMTITPWHDSVDFDIAERHKLPYEQVIDFRGKLLPIAGEFAGMKISEARAKIIEKLSAKGLVEKIDENYSHTVPLCYKCRTTIEPQVRAQWFVKMSTLAKKAKEAIEKDEVKMVTESHKNIALHWLENIRDWNISRQIAWGIPIPAKLCVKCENGFVDLEDKLTTCADCGSELEKDTDTFDTWFSSGQWPFATLGFPNGEDFKKFYPTAVMETGHDILMFWVLRMIMLGIYRTGIPPFKTVYLHGLVRDAKGQKMSKSKGNVIDPLEISQKFGTDALRMGLIIGNTPGNDLNLDPQKILAYKKFANKLWNIARFVLENSDTSGISSTKPENEILSHLNFISSEVTNDFENFRFHLAGEKLYHYVWHEFADKIIEESKPVLNGSDEKAKIERRCVLFESLTIILKLLHPFMPFITETIWQKLPKKESELLMIARWPANSK